MATNDEIYKAKQGCIVVTHYAREGVSQFNDGRYFWSGKTCDDIDMGQLAEGVEVEGEHIRDYLMQTKIALDHLAEIPDYYTRLKQMEEEAGIY